MSCFNQRKGNMGSECELKGNVGQCHDTDKAG